MCTLQPFTRQCYSDLFTKDETLGTCSTRLENQKCVQKVEISSYNGGDYDDDSLLRFLRRVVSYKFTDYLDDRGSKNL